MADDNENNENKGFFSRIKDYAKATMEEKVLKVRLEREELQKAQKAAKMNEEDDFNDALYRKSIYRDPSYSVGAQGWQEKTNRLSFELLRHMANQNTTVMGIIQTRQNQVAAFARPVKGPFQKGFKIELVNEQSELERIKQQLFPDAFSKKKSSNSDIQQSEDARNKLQNADNDLTSQEIQDSTKDDLDPTKLSQREMERLARQELMKQTKDDIQSLTSLVLSCGSLKERSFESKKWHMDSLLRAITRDTLTFDLYGIERIEDEAGRLHHWIPVDGSTIRYATPQLKHYKDYTSTEFSENILFPEKELEAMRDPKEDILKLDNEKLENDEYKYVQVVRGKIERAFTPSELVVGMRNPTTNIYANGYSLAELELLISVISSHIFTENYNKLYFSNGFSAKGILHIKANLTRRKLETLRLQWKHMVSGNRNSFQTPILAGMEEVQWIPLTQTHSDMEFDRWLNYLIKSICMVFQIDPIELGFGMKEEGGSGSGLGGDNTSQKISHSKDKGLVPLIKHIEAFLNMHIISKLNPRYELKFVGLDDETQTEATDREAKEVKYLRTLNELRVEHGYAPIEGADDVILDPTYFQWYSQFHPQAKQNQQQNGEVASPEMSNFFEQGKQPNPEKNPEKSIEGENPNESEKGLNKSLVRIEQYEIEE